jgi:radical SAM protein with 4Fe4S-binding SPASM domain
LKSIENDVVCAGKKYTIFHEMDKYCFFPESAALIKCDSATAKLLDFLSVPASVNTAVRFIEKEFSIGHDEIKAGIEKLVETGILYYNGVLKNKMEANTLSVSSEAPAITTIQPARMASIHITDKCTLNCIYCMNKKEREDSTSQSIGLHNWTRILDDIYINGVKEVCFSGGEPLVVDYIAKVIEYANSIGIIVSIITNGTQYTSEVIAALKNNVRVTVSLDSNDKTTNDKNRGIGAYDRTTEFLNVLNSNGIKFTINTVLTKYNIDTFYESTAELCDKYEMLKMITPIPQECSSSGHELSLYSMSQYECFMERLLSYSQGKEQLKARIDYSSLKRIGLKKGCGVAKAEFMIGPDGAIYPCRALYKERFRGSVLNGSNFRNVWLNDSVLQELRFADSCRANDCANGGCDFWQFCAGGCFAQTYELCGELRSCANNMDCHKLKVRTAKRIVFALISQEKQLVT